MSLTRNTLQLVLAIATCVSHVALAQTATGGTPEATPYAETFESTVRQLSGDTLVTLGPVKQLSTQTWIISDQTVRRQVATLAIGDVVSVTLLEGSTGDILLTSIAVKSIVTTTGERLMMYSLSLGMLFLLTLLLARGKAKWLLVGADGRMSNSITQAALWYLMLMSSYLTIVMMRVRAGGWDYVTGVSIPENLAWLSVASAASLVGAKQIVMSRIARTPGGQAKVKPHSRSRAHLSDLVTDDSGARADFGDFQMMLVTLIAVAVYLATFLSWLAHITLSAKVALPDVDSTLLTAFGIGQGAYLGKKLAGDSGAGTTAPIQPTRIVPPRPQDLV